jgi:glutathione S-transferase
MTRIKVSAFRWVPPFAQGLVRDLRVRWALEEAGMPYEARLIGREDQASESYRRLQPFGQVPAYEEDDLVMFESGAIVLHIAERSRALLPPEVNARARAKTWMFAALNTVEPPIMFLNALDDLPADAEADGGRKAAATDFVKRRLASLSDWLEGRDYLEDRFTAADLLMTTVLQIPRGTGLVEEFPNLDAYRKRCESRPAFEKALAAQMAPFAENAPAGA